MWPISNETSKWVRVHLFQSHELPLVLDLRHVPKWGSSWGTTVSDSKYLGTTRFLKWSLCCFCKLNRPIDLVEYAYKLLAKLFMYRLKNLLPMDGNGVGWNGDPTRPLLLGTSLVVPQSGSRRVWVSELWPESGFGAGLGFGWGCLDPTRLLIFKYITQQRVLCK